MHPDEDNIFKDIWEDKSFDTYFMGKDKELSKVTDEIHRAIDQMIIQSPMAEPTRSVINRADQYSRVTTLYDKLFDLLGRMTGVMESYFDPSVVPEELKQISSELHELRKEFNRGL